MKDVIQSTISKIKQEHIKPEARWKFLVKKYGPWLGFMVLALVSASALAAALAGVENLDWDLYRYAKNGPVAYLLSILPYFWMIILALLATATFIDLRNTQSGYKFSWLKILSFSLGAMLLGGLAGFFLGFGNRFDGMMTSHMSGYGGRIMMTKQMQWKQPEKGFLAGTIIKVNPDVLELKDLNDSTWKIVKNANTVIRPLVTIKEGEMVKIIGSQLPGHEFEAREIRPWVGPGMMGGQSPARPMMTRPMMR